MGKVIDLNCITRLNIDPDKVLESAVGKLEGVVIIGYDKQEEEYFASSYADGAEVLWLLERMKKALLELPDE